MKIFRNKWTKKEKKNLIKSLIVGYGITLIVFIVSFISLRSYIGNDIIQMTWDKIIWVVGIGFCVSALIKNIIEGRI